MTTLTIGTPDQPYIAGDSLKIQFQVLETDGVTPTDLTGAVIRWGLSKMAKSAAALIKSSASGGVTITDAINGLGEVVIAKGDIRTAGNFWHELEIQMLSGESFTHFSGPFHVTGSIFPDT